MPCIRIQPRARLVAGSQGSRWRLPVLALLASVLLTGCVVRIAYGQLEWLTRWSVESYLDLNDGQERLVREIIGRNLAWHRATELPQYAAYLRELRAGLSGPVSAEFMARQYATTLVISDRTLQQISPDIARLLLTLNDEQVSEFIDEIEERNTELAEEYSGYAPEVRRKIQDRSIIRVFRWFTGTLSPDQEAVVKSHTAGMHDLTEQWLQRRRAWQSGSLPARVQSRGGPEKHQIRAQLQRRQAIRGTRQRRCRCERMAPRDLYRLCHHLRTACR